MMAREEYLDLENLKKEIELLQNTITKGQFDVVVAQLQKLVHGYQPS
jgi:hypothetical protein